MSNLSGFGWITRWWFFWRWSREQRRLRKQLVDYDSFDWALDGLGGRRLLRLIGGMDISFFADPQGPNDPRAYAALVVCEVDSSRCSLELVWERYDLVDMTEVYIAGFLAFREVHHLRALLETLRSDRPDLMPDVILVDGNGVLHPRGFGLASHLGVVCDVCTVGVGKDLHLVDGLNRDEVKRQVQSTDQGGHVNLIGESGRAWGAALLPQPLKPIDMKRQAPPKNPIYVSVGHKISLDTSVELVKSCCISARVPEPVRLADVRSRERVREVKERERRSAEEGGGGPLEKAARQAKRKQKGQPQDPGAGLQAAAAEVLEPARAAESAAQVEALCELIRVRKEELRGEGKGNKEIKLDGRVKELSTQLAGLRAAFTPAAPAVAVRAAAPLEGAPPGRLHPGGGAGALALAAAAALLLLLLHRTRPAGR